jgi:hypothetical protein
MRVTSILIPSVVVFALLGGCGSDEQEPPLTPASYPTPMARYAGESITHAACVREQRCNRIGPTAKYDNFEHCMNVKRPDAFKHVRDCRAGIDQGDLNQCVAENGRSVRGLTASLVSA